MKKKMFKSMMLIGLGVAGTIMYEKYNKEIMKAMKQGYNAIEQKMMDMCEDCN